MTEIEKEAETKLSDLYGSIPDFTSGLPTELFLKIQRSEVEVKDIVDYTTSLLQKIKLYEEALGKYEPIIDGLTTCVAVCSREMPIMDMFNHMQDDGTARLERSWDWEEGYDGDWIVPKDQIEMQNPYLGFTDGRALAKIFPLILELPKAKEYRLRMRVEKHALEKAKELK